MRTPPSSPRSINPTMNDRLMIAIFAAIERRMTPSILESIQGWRIENTRATPWTYDVINSTVDSSAAVGLINEILTRMPMLLSTVTNNMPMRRLSMNGLKIFDFAVYNLRADIVEYLLSKKDYVEKIDPTTFYKPINISYSNGRMRKVPSLFHLMVKTKNKYYTGTRSVEEKLSKMYKEIMKVTPDGTFKLAMHNHGWFRNNEKLPLEMLFKPLFEDFGIWENYDSDDENIDEQDPDDMLSDIADTYTMLQESLIIYPYLDFLHSIGDNPSRVVVDRIRDLHARLLTIETEIETFLHTSQLITELFENEIGSFFNSSIENVDPYWTENDVINMTNITNSLIFNSPENLEEGVLEWLKNYEFQYSNSKRKWVIPSKAMPIDLGANNYSKVFKYRLQDDTELPYRYWWGGRDDPLMFYEQDIPVSRHDKVRLLDPISGYETWEIIDFKSLNGQNYEYTQYLAQGIPVHIRRRENSIYQNEKRDKPYNVFLVRGRRRTDVSVVTQYVYVSNYEIEFVQTGNFLSDINDVTQWDHWTRENHYWDDDMQIWRAARTLYDSSDEDDETDINNRRYMNDSDYEWDSEDESWENRAESGEYERDPNGEWRWVPNQHIVGSERNVGFWQDENYGWDDESHMWFEIHDDILGSTENRRYHRENGRHWEPEEESWVDDEDGDDEGDYATYSSGEEEEELSHNRLLELLDYNNVTNREIYYDDGGQIRLGDHVLVNNDVVGIVITILGSGLVLVLEENFTRRNKSDLKFIFRMAIYTRPAGMFIDGNIVNDNWTNIHMRNVKIGDIVRKPPESRRMKVVRINDDNSVICKPFGLGVSPETLSTYRILSSKLVLEEKTKRKSRDGMGPVVLFPDKTIVTYGDLKATHTRASRPVRKNDIITAVINNETKVLLIDFVEFIYRSRTDGTTFMSPQIICSEAAGEIADVAEDFVLNVERSLRVTYRGHSVDKLDINGTDKPIVSQSLKYPGGRYIRTNDVVCYSKNRHAFEDITNMLFKIRTIGNTNLSDDDIAWTDPVNNISPGPLIYIQEIKEEDRATAIAAGRVIATTKNRLRWLSSDVTSDLTTPLITRRGNNNAANNPFDSVPPPGFNSTSSVSRRLNFSGIGTSLNVYIQQGSSEFRTRPLFYFEQENAPPFEIVETENYIKIGDRVEDRYKDDDYAWKVVGLANLNHQADDDKYEHVTNKEYIVPPDSSSEKYILPYTRDKRGAVIVIKNENNEYRRVIAFDIIKYKVRAFPGMEYTLESFRKVRLPRGSKSLTLKIPDEDIYCDVGDSSSSKIQPVIVSESNRNEYAKQGDIWFVFCAKELQAYLNSREGHHGFTWNARDDDSNTFNEGRLHNSNPFTKNRIYFVKFMDQKMIDLHLQNLEKKKQQKKEQTGPSMQIKRLTDKEVEDFKKRINKLKEELKKLEEGKGTDRAIKEVKDKIFRLEQPLSQTEFAKAEDNYKEIVTNNMIMMMQKQRDSARRRLDEAEKAGNQREIIAAKQSIQQFTRMIESQIAAEMKRREAAQKKRPREEDDETKEEDSVASRVRQRRRNELLVNFIKLKI